VKLEAVQPTVRADGPRDGMREAATTRTSLDDGRAGPDRELLKDEGDVGRIEDLGSVRKGQRPKLGRRPEELRKVTHASVSPQRFLGRETRSLT
jgi:hypothetical protein